MTAIFGTSASDNVGLHSFPINQAAPVLSTSFPTVLGGREHMPCLVPAAIDQDPYFRMTRDICQRLHEPKPATIYSKYLPDLQGMSQKMSSTVQTSHNLGVVFLDSTANQIKKVINKYAFSGGQETTELHRQLGGNPDVDVSYQYLRFFMENDQELQKIEDDYRTGQLLTGQLKAILIKLLQEKLASFQTRRGQVTDETVQAYMTERCILWD